MNKLTQQILNELRLQIFNEVETGDTNVVVVYPGDFQPMSLQHKMVYNWLTKKFGKDKVYLLTTDKVDAQKFPLTFEEKKSIINKFGIQNIVKVNLPYVVSDVIAKLKLDPQKTSLIYCVESENRKLLRGIGKVMAYNQTTLLPIKDGDNPYVYYVVPPESNIEIPNLGKMSDDNVRKALGDRDAKLAELKERFKLIMGWLDPAIFNIVISRFNTNRGKLKEDVNDWFRFISNMTQEQGSLFFDILKKEYGDTKDLLPIIQKFIKGGKLTQKEKSAFQTQMKDTFKLMGLGTIAAIPIPGTMLLIPVIVQLAKKFNINLLPDTTTEKIQEEGESLPIVRREFWDEVFTEVAKEEEPELIDEVITIPNDLISKLEDESIKLLKSLADEFNEETTLFDIITNVGDFVNGSKTENAFQEMTLAVNTWMDQQTFVKKHRKEYNVRPSVLLNIHVNGDLQMGPFPEISKMLQYCADNSCGAISDEISAIYDNDEESDYEANSSVDYSKFYTEMHNLGGFGDFIGDAELKVSQPDGEDYIFCSIGANVHFLPLCIVFVLIKSGHIQYTTVDSVITNFVKRYFVPAIAHELTHLSQITQQKSASNKVQPSSYQNVSILNPNFWDIYLADKGEVGAHATEFVQHMKTAFPTKTNKELLKMLQTNSIPNDISSAYEKYFKTFFTDVVGDKTNPTKQRFVKTIYQIMSQ